MCGMCGTPTPPAKWFMVGLDASAGQTIRERAKQIRLLTKLLSSVRITVNANPATPGLTLKTPDGRNEFILDIGDVWPAVERLVGHPYDPLANVETS